jgi:Domain of unknown function (DUF1840)
MPTIFKSKATGDLIMVSAHAEQVLECIHKTAKQAGILQPHEMAHALEVLRMLPDLSPSDSDGVQESGDKTESQSVEVPPADVPMSDNISLHKRAWPLVRMIEAASAANQAIVWGV